jgi:spore germination protein
MTKHPDRAVRRAARRAGGRSTPRPGLLALAALSIVTLSLVLGLVVPVPHSPAGSHHPGVTSVHIGYVPYWDQRRGFATVRANLDLLDQVSPVWYSLEPTGEIVLADPEHTRVDPRTVRSLQQQGVKVIPTVTNLRGGQWQPDLVPAMLHDPTAASRHVEALVELAVGEGYDGIDIDYEHLRAQDRQPLSALLGKLGAALRGAGKVLTVAVHPKDSEEGDDERNVAQDYRAIGEAADQVRVMAYDYSWEDSPPGPVAPLAWVAEIVAWTLTQVPAHKVVLGIVLLGYDWAGGQGTTVDHEQARAAARAYGTTVHRTSDGSPWFAYQDASGSRHEVWFEDAVSVRAKLDLVSANDLRGAFFWRLGGEDPRVWPVLREQR